MWLKISPNNKKKKEIKIDNKEQAEKEKYTIKEWKLKWKREIIRRNIYKGMGQKHKIINSLKHKKQKKLKNYWKKGKSLRQKMKLRK